MNFKKYLPVLIFAVLLVAGLLLRSWRLEQLAGFDFDQETAAWLVKKLLIDHKFSLVGQEISLGGIFIGPLFYYLLAIFYFLFRLDPLAANVLVAIISILTMLLLYLLAKNLFGQRSGLLALFLYAFSFQINFYDRTTAPSNLIMPLSLLLFYLLTTKMDLNKKIVACGIIFGLAISVHPTVFLLLPLMAWYFWDNKSQISRQHFLLAILIFLIFLAPLAFFELRHSFVGLGNSLTAAVLPAVTGHSYPFLFKFLINIRTLFQSFGQIVFPQNTLWPWALTLVFFSFTIIWKLSRLPFVKWLFLWAAAPIVLLSFYQQTVPEYYFLAVFPIFLIFLAAYWEKMLFSKAFFLGGTFLLAFSVLNLAALFSYDNPVGLSYKKMAVNYIAQQTGTGPVAVTTIADPGQNNGFAYLFFYRGISLSQEARSRYIIAIPAKNSSAPGKIFGGIKVVEE